MKGPKIFSELHAYDERFLVKDGFAQRSWNRMCCPSTILSCFSIFGFFFCCQSLWQEEVCCPMIEEQLFMAISSFVKSEALGQINGECHYPLVIKGSCFPDNFLVFLLQNSWVGSGSGEGQDAELLYLLSCTVVTQPTSLFFTLSSHQG